MSVKTFLRVRGPAHGIAYKEQDKIQGGFFPLINSKLLKTKTTFAFLKRSITLIPQKTSYSFNYLKRIKINTTFFNIDKQQSEQ